MQAIKILNAVVRPIITLSLVAAFIWGFIVGLIQPGEFITASSLVLGFWFREREQKNGQE